MAKFKSRKIQSPPFVLSHPHLIEPQVRQPRPGQQPREPQYNCVAIFPPKDYPIPAGAPKGFAWGDLTEMKKLAAEARDGFFKTKPKGLKTTFFKCEEKWEEKDDGEAIPVPGYMAGGTFINVNAGTRQAPDCRDQRMRPITSAQVLYPGCICIGVFSAYGYDQEGNRGVKFSLECLQKIAEGENIAGRVRAEDYFRPVEELAGGADEGATNADEFGSSEDEDENF